MFHTVRVKNISGTPTEILDEIIGYGCGNGNSDIHIDPGAQDVRIRYRKDGMLQLFATYSLLVHEEVIRRLKILARIRTDDSFSARDGRFSLTVENVHYDIRTVTTPSYFGESVTLRILRPLDVSISLETLGFSTEDAVDIINHARSCYRKDYHSCALRRASGRNSHIKLNKTLRIYCFRSYP
ncbi:MAG TPA: ATPase, T2SS/T4P/T4SS family [Candidatus Paceibacterota bacterium]|nr:ATPase, T2SS/T4P/T4SS family [Candidatus Paceibacterota bacterium]